MRPYLLSLPLVFTYGGLIKNKNILSEAIQLKGNRRARCYWPKGKEKTKLPGIYLQHGLSIFGIDDRRIIDLAENLSHCGFSVILPELTEVVQLRMSLETIDNIESLGLELSDLKSWYDGKRFGFFSVSFSSGMGLIACSRPGLADRVRSFMAVGGYCDFLDTFPFVFQNFSKDNYGVMVLLYNLLDRVDKALGEELREVFYLAAVDNAKYRLGEEAEAPKLLKSRSPKAQDFFWKVMDSEEFRTQLARDLQNSYPIELPKSFSPYYQMGGLKSPVSLLHGDSDPVISPEESKKLANYFKEKGHKHVFRTSTALTHGDNLPLHEQISGVPSLLKTFGSFLYWLKS
ncbi:alpha/beta hydrolase family protein [Leptospira ryugenii]|uniref:Alpha/beta hydrolase family protein n=1 Tax=Leptospira ryugenii TaxID=1917863 RepID=A0A2P2E4I8_9LEPT|nr:alpha/beta hydrolase [Leptospira ryugenii]GBF51766.1 alpha/beta hydrolase family protein [Leptospira ryugenii]